MLALALAALLSASWRQGDLPAASVADVAPHPKIAGLVFAATASGVYRSSDFGRHWQRVADFATHTIGITPVHALAFNPFDDNELCVLGDSALACSADLGGTWTTQLQPGISFLLFDPRVRDRLFVGAPYGPNWLYVSSDHGATWTSRGFLANHNPWFHEAAAIGSAIIEDGSPHGGCVPFCSLFRSDDDGASWRSILDEEASWILADRTLIAGAFDGTISVSNDLGITWQMRGRLPFGPMALAANAAQLFAGSSAGMLFRSADGGATWTRIDDSMLGGDSIEHIAVANDGTVYVATRSQVFTSAAEPRRRSARH